MFLYKSYCYLTINDLQSSIASDPFIGSGKFISSSLVNVDLVSVDLTIDDTGTLTTFNFVPPTCTQVGFDNSFTGVSTLDAVEMSWLVVAAFAAAYAIKVLRRSF